MIPGRLLLIIIADYLLVLYTVLAQHSPSKLRTFYIQNYSCSGLSTSRFGESRSHWNCLFLLELWDLLRKGDRLLSTTAALHCSLLKNILCNILLVSKFSVSYDTMFCKIMGALFFTKQLKAPFLEERIVSYDTTNNHVSCKCKISSALIPNFIEASAECSGWTQKWYSRKHFYRNLFHKNRIIAEKIILLYQRMISNYSDIMFDMYKQSTKTLQQAHFVIFLT